MLQRRFSFFRRTIVDPATVVAYGGTAAIGLWFGLGVWALVLAVYVSQIVDLILVWVMARWRPDIRLASWQMWRELVRYARYIMTSEFLRQAGVMFNTAVIGRFVGRADLAQYNFGYRIGTQAPTAMVAAVAYVLFPALARIASDSDRFGRAVLQSFRSGCFTAFPVSLILVPLGEPLAVLLFGERWRTAGQVIAVLAPIGAGLALRSISTEVFKAAGEVKILPWLYALSTLLPAAAVFAGVSFGVPVVAAGVASGLVVVGLCSAYFAARVAGLRTSALVKAISVPTLASATMIAVVYALEHFVVHSSSHGEAIGILLLSAEALVGGGIYIAAVLLLDAAMVKEFVSSLSTAWNRRIRTASVSETTPVPQS